MTRTPNPASSTASSHFIGGGPILEHEDGATSASIWNTGTLGVAVGAGRINLAILVSVVNVATLRMGAIVKGRSNTENKEDE